MIPPGPDPFNRGNISRDYIPKPFSESQRELFRRVARLNRQHPDDFMDADRWLGTKPMSAAEELERYRKEICENEKERRASSNRLWGLNLPGAVQANWRARRRWEQKYLLRDPDDVK